MEDEAIVNRELSAIEEGFAERVMRIPLRNEPPLSPYWLHLEVIERYHVVRSAHINPGESLVEIGCGPHALATVPLAYLAGEQGRVCAVDRGRWRYFEHVLQAAALRERVMPVWCDAVQLPLQSGSCDTALSLHALRSFRDEATIVDIFKEMFRVSSRLFVAESLPIAKTKAQKAHIEMYNLREEIFELVTGRKDDIHYFPLEKLAELVECAGGSVIQTESIDVDLPHFLAFIPKEYVEKIEDEEKREDLLLRWEKAYNTIVTHGEEHPPVGIVSASP